MWGEEALREEGVGVVEVGGLAVAGVLVVGDVGLGGLLVGGLWWEKGDVRRLGRNGRRLCRRLEERLWVGLRRRVGPGAGFRLLRR